MAVQYRVSGDVPVTPAIAPVQHNWNPLYRGLEMEEAKRQAKLKAEAEARAAKAQQAADEAKYNPGGILDVDYNDVVHSKGLEVLDYSAKSYASGRTGSGEHNYNINRLRQEAELAKGKSNAAIAEYTKAYQNIDQLPSYVNKNLLNTKVYDTAHPKRRDGKVDINAIDPKAIAEIPANYYGAINTADMYNEKVKGLGEKIQKGEVQFPIGDPNDPNAIMNVVKSDLYKAKFFKPVADKYGKITYQPGVTDQAARFMLENDQEIMGEAKNQLQQYIQSETAARAQAGDKRDLREIYTEVERGVDADKFLIDHVKNNLERLNAPTHETERKTTITARPGGDKKKVSLVEARDQQYNYALGKNAEGKDRGVAKVYTPQEFRLSGPERDRKMSINSTKMVNIGTNENIPDKDLVGSQDFYPYSIVKTAMQKTKNGNLQIVTDSKENQAKGDIVYKWMVHGNIQKEVQQGENADGSPKYKTVKIPAITPYEEIETDLTDEFNITKDMFDKGDGGFGSPKKKDPLGIN